MVICFSVTFGSSRCEVNGRTNTDIERPKPLRQRQAEKIGRGSKEVELQTTVQFDLTDESDDPFKHSSIVLQASGRDATAGSFGRFAAH